MKTELTVEQNKKLVDWGFSPRCGRELFDITDLLVLLPRYATITDSDGNQKEKMADISMILYNDGWEVDYSIGKSSFFTMQNEELIDAVYKIVIWCIEKGIIKSE